MGGIFECEVQTPCTVKAESQSYRFSLEGVPIFSSWMAFGVHRIRSKGWSEGDVEVDVAHGMAVSHVAMWTDGEFSWSDDSQAGECLVSITYPLGFMWLMVVSGGGGVGENLWFHGQGVEEGNAE